MNTLSIAIKEFINHCKFEKNLSSKTTKAYQIDLRQLLDFFVNQNFSMEIDAITKIELREYLESIFTLKPKSIKRKMATIKAMFNYLEFDDRIAINPIRKMQIKIKEPSVLPRVLNIQQIRTIFRAAYDLNEKVKDEKSYKYFETLRDIAVVELLFATGGRVSEIANLKTDQMDLKSGVVVIKGKGNKERLIQICNKEIIGILEKYRKLSLNKVKNAENYFLINRFNKNLSDQSIRGIVKKLCKKAGMNIPITPHVFRHSFATLLLEKDVDIKYIQSMLGHSSIATTQIYTHVNRQKQKQILKNKHPRKDFSINNFSYTE